MSTHLQIRKRDGSLAALDVSQIGARIDGFVNQLQLFDGLPLGQQIMDNVLQRLSKHDSPILDTSYIDSETVAVCLELSDEYADCAVLARYLHIDNAHKQRARVQPLNVDGYIRGMCGNYNPYTCTTSTWLSPRTIEKLRLIGPFIDYDLDYAISQEGFEVLEKSYLMKCSHDGGPLRVFELPAECFARLAIELTADGDHFVNDWINSYYWLVRRFCTMSTPVINRGGLLFNSLAACYLMRPTDSTSSIYEVNKLAALHASGGGGIGLVSYLIREKGGYISTTGAKSNGSLAYMRSLEITSKNTSQPARPASTAIYCSDTQPDIEEHITTRVETGSGIKCLSLFVGVMLNNIFLRRLAVGKPWTLIPPIMAPDLNYLWGDAFDERYRYYEALYKDHPLVKSVPIARIWSLITSTKIASGMPYCVSRTNATRFSPQQHLIEQFGEGEIQLNLCTEVALYVRPGEIATCILGAVVIPFCVHYSSRLDCAHLSNEQFGDLTRALGKPLFDFAPAPKRYVAHRLYELYHGSDPTPETIVGHYGAYLDVHELGLAAYQQCMHLNQILEHNQYPSEHSRAPSQRDRPIGIGMQGLFDTLTLLCFPVDSDAGRDLNKLVAATVYYYSLLASIDLARYRGRSYDTYPGSPFSRGRFQFDIRNDYINERLAQLGPDETPTLNRWLEDLIPIVPHSAYNWDALRSYMLEHGLSNGTLTAGQPTETSAKMNRVCEMCEPFRGHKIVMRIDKQVTTIRNQKLVRLCNNLGIPAGPLLEHAADNNGSIMTFPGLPPLMYALFRIVFDYDPHFMIDLTADREPYMDMAQSHNLYLPKPSTKLVTEATLYAMRKMLVTYSYYTRIRASPTIRVTSNNSGLVDVSTLNLSGAAPQITECYGCSS